MRFKDVFSIIGPSMIGPSSSHTAGAVRLGRVARQLLGEQPKKVEITLYGSFADTYRGHGTDLALIGGLLDYETDDPRIPVAAEEAEALGVEIAFLTSKDKADHPNTVRFILSSDTRELSMTGASIGGGNVEIVNVNQFDVKFTAVYPTLVISHHDRPGMIADITALLGRSEINIGFMDLDRKGRDREAMTVIETDVSIPDSLIQELKNLSMIYEIKKVDLAERGE
ncbi:L-serine ammonia-lyase, iron-sulfur-dependent subunit beta [Paenibacillus alginolyticus]|uniref:L-serine ammonia-lyase, iron-sulfur-dependent subunit beta n=1 Tax=Paenibacillus alginolyticus TaxID=59839 RepID=UPI001567713A|nr:MULTISPECIES: L-serine ammonia-lyase, iron-sulfur-dependent subunit beta [Paenibacillus]MEC0142192.1 L-serine ammonia-lyase, iron-sulfur-dependent subunit beta [Paenibacillus alginolyticus]NRF90344.1 L-serine ammonia-lyase, iron-sulfur-dependent, subunit beta [Paenibacillus frigoriresistens]